MTTNPTIDRQVDAFNRHDADAFAACYAANAVVNDPQAPQPLRDTAAITRDVSEWFGAFPDVQSRVVSVVFSGDRYAVEWSMTGTHKGPLAGPAGHIPATNKSVTVAVATLGRLNGQGRIVEESRYYDLAGVMGQLGILQ